MRFAFSPEQIRERVQPESVLGTLEQPVTGVATLQEAQPGDLSFLGNAKYKADVAATQASVVLLPADWQGEGPRAGQAFLLVDNPSLALARVCVLVEQSLWPAVEPGRHPTALIDPTAEVADSAYIGPHCVVEAGARIGAGVYLHSHVVVGREAVLAEGARLMSHVVIAGYCRVGKRVRIQPGAVIGGDGFGYEPTPEGVERLPQVGIVELEDDVDIGANTTIDRARLGVTRVGTCTKVDNLVMIAHNVVIGKGCFVISQVGISGSCTIGDGVILAGQVGLTGHLKIGDGARIGAQSGINYDIDPKAYVRGSPARPFHLEMRLEVLKQRLPDLFKRVEKLEGVLEKDTLEKA
ncbi:MAG: UDP-3-O-(3-hydroxymyristoyl)glucosamine N-acyltransferase [Opitutales bacterium]